MRFHVSQIVEILDERFLFLFNGNKKAYGQIKSINVSLNLDPIGNTFILDGQDTKETIKYQNKYKDMTKDKCGYWVSINGSYHCFNHRQIRKLTRKELSVFKVLKS